MPSPINAEFSLDFSLEGLRDVLRTGVRAMCTAAGSAVLHKMMEEDLTPLIGPKGKHNPDCIGFWAYPSSVDTPK